MRIARQEVYSFSPEVAPVANLLSAGAGDPVAIIKIFHCRWVDASAKSRDSKIIRRVNILFRFSELLGNKLIPKLARVRPGPGTLITFHFEVSRCHEHLFINLKNHKIPSILLRIMKMAF